jgi:hypothetical protein
VGAINDAAAAAPNFGGVSIDQAAGGVIDVRIVDTGSANAQALATTLRALVPSDDPVQFVDAPYSWSALVAGNDAISTAAGMGDLHSLGVVGVALYGDGVTVYLDNRISTEAESTLRSKYPFPFVSYRRISPNPVDLQNRNRTSGPLYGGEWISDTSAQCTNGFASAEYLPTGSYWTVTAGHCGVEGDYWRQGTFGSGGNHFGDGGRYQAPNYSGYHGTTQKCDCQVIGPIPNSARTFNMYTTGNALYSFTSIPSNTASDFYIGRAVCVSGAHYADDHSDGITCGTITTVNLTIPYYDSADYAPNQVSFSNLVMTSIIDTEEGDSGAPVASYHAYMGVHDGLFGDSYYGYNEYFSRSTYIAATTTATPVV